MISTGPKRREKGEYVRKSELFPIWLGWVEWHEASCRYICSYRLHAIWNKSDVMGHSEPGTSLRKNGDLRPPNVISRYLLLKDQNISTSNQVDAMRCDKTFWANKTVVKERNSRERERTTRVPSLWEAGIKMSIGCPAWIIYSWVWICDLLSGVAMTWAAVEIAPLSFSRKARRCIGRICAP